MSALRLLARCFDGFLIRLVARIVVEHQSAVTHTYIQISNKNKQLNMIADDGGGVIVVAVNSFNLLRNYFYLAALTSNVNVSSFHGVAQWASANVYNNITFPLRARTYTHTHIYTNSAHLPCICMQSRVIMRCIGATCRRHRCAHFLGKAFQYSWKQTFVCMCVW